MFYIIVVNACHEWTWKLRYSLVFNSTVLSSALICDLDGKKNLKAETPQSVKKGGKTPSSEAKDKSPKSGGLICKSCSKYDILQKPTNLALLNCMMTWC